MLSLLSFFLLFLRTEGFRHVSLFHSKRCSSSKYGGVELNVAPIVQAAEMPQPAVISFSTLVDSIANEEVARLAFTPDESVVLLETKDGETQTAVVVPSARNRLIDQLLSSDVEFSGSLVAPPPRPGIGDQVITGIVGVLSVISNVVFPLFLLYILVSTLLVGRRGPGIGPAGSGGGGPMTQMNPFEFGKSKDAVDLQPSTGVTFDDVAGCDEAKFELREVVDFLMNTTKYADLGAVTPRGVLLEGPPGTGKTLMARATAGEARVPFISTTGSSFVEMFVGVGASRVRDIFAKAKANAPCIIFIDEIDAVAKKRAGAAAGRFGGSDEQEQTLNQILSEMDGFEGASGVVVLAATNRADVLDQALLRPGRFDRRIALDLPDRKGREAVLKVHAKKKPLDSSVDLADLAARTTGFSGASLANLLNEASIVAARRDKREISIEEINYALDRVTVGLEKRTGMNSEERKKLVAYHEAGHAVVGLLTPGFDEIEKVTIVPRSGGAGGFTLFTPSDERQDLGMFSQRYLKDQLAVALGGRVAEELVFGEEETTTGASNDLQKVADVARKMVTQWGFASKKLSSTAWEPPSGSAFGMPQMASQATQEKIDVEVAAIVDGAYRDCQEKLTTNRKLLDEMVLELVQKENLGRTDIKRLQELYAKTPPTKAKSSAENAKEGFKRLLFDK